MIAKASGNDPPSFKVVKWFKADKDEQPARLNAIVKLDPETKERALSSKAELKDDPKFG